LTKEEIDEEILEAAAALFARHGMERTSVQRVADAVGYSKTGLLHRFPTKEALEEATVAHTVDRFERIATRVAGHAAGPGRDREVLEALVDLAGQRPGLVSFMLTTISQGSLSADRLDVLGEVLFRSFDTEFVPTGAASSAALLERSVRITNAVGGLAVTSLAFGDLDPSVLRPLLVTAALGALGHTHPED
jgi:AcrR family transcriptional regulator